LARRQRPQLFSKAHWDNHDEDFRAVRNLAGFA
jgi:hypothetical protein